MPNLPKGLPKLSGNKLVAAGFMAGGIFLFYMGYKHWKMS